MTCERCGACMMDEQVSVSGGIIIVKNVLAWHCTRCGSVEYEPLIDVKLVASGRR